MVYALSFFSFFFSMVTTLRKSYIPNAIYPLLYSQNLSLMRVNYLQPSMWRLYFTPMVLVSMQRATYM